MRVQGLEKLKLLRTRIRLFKESSFARTLDLQLLIPVLTDAVEILIEDSLDFIEEPKMPVDQGSLKR